MNQNQRDNNVDSTSTTAGNTTTTTTTKSNISNITTTTTTRFDGKSDILNFLKFKPLSIVHCNKNGGITETNYKSFADVLHEDIVYHQNKCINEQTLYPPDNRFRQTYDLWLKHQSCFWSVHENDPSVDRDRFKSITPPAFQKIILKTVGCLGFGDSIVIDSIAGNLLDKVTSIELKAMLTDQESREFTHKKMYNHMLEVSDNADYYRSAQFQHLYMNDLRTLANKYRLNDIRIQMYFMMMCELILFAPMFQTICYAAIKGYCPKLCDLNLLVMRDEYIHYENARLQSSLFKHKLNIYFARSMLGEFAELAMTLYFKILGNYDDGVFNYKHVYSHFKHIIHGFMVENGLYLSETEMLENDKLYGTTPAEFYMSLPKCETRINRMESNSTIYTVPGDTSPLVRLNREEIIEALTKVKTNQSSNVAAAKPNKIITTTTTTSTPSSLATTPSPTPLSKSLSNVSIDNSMSDRIRDYEIKCQGNADKFQYRKIHGRNKIEEDVNTSQNIPMQSIKHTLDDDEEYEGETSILEYNNRNNSTSETDDKTTKKNFIHKNETAQTNQCHVGTEQSQRDNRSNNEYEGELSKDEGSSDVHNTDTMITIELMPNAMQAKTPTPPTSPTLPPRNFMNEYDNVIIHDCCSFESSRSSISTNHSEDVKNGSIKGNSNNSNCVPNNIMDRNNYRMNDCNDTDSDGDDDDGCNGKNNNNNNNNNNTNNYDSNDDDDYYNEEYAISTTTYTTPPQRTVTPGAKHLLEIDHRILKSKRKFTLNSRKNNQKRPAACKRLKY